MSDKNSSAMYIKQILMNTANSIKTSEMVIIDSKLQGNAKNKFLQIINKLRGVEKEIYLSVSPEYAKIIKDEVLENWDTMSAQNIMVMMSTMDDIQRQTLEECAGHILAGTFQVEEKGERKFTLEEMRHCFNESRISDKITGNKHFSFEQFLKNEIK